MSKRRSKNASTELRATAGYVDSSKPPIGAPARDLADSPGSSSVWSQLVSSPPPPIRISDGTLEALKWLALVLMTLDHINKYLLHDSMSVLYSAGRLAMPLFGICFAINLARPGALDVNTFSRICSRLTIGGAIATPPFMALGGLAWGWWPLNILFTLLVAAGVVRLVELGARRYIAAAAVLFIVGGGNVEFWWPAIGLILASWCYVRRPSWASLALAISATGALYAVNGNLWALAALPLIVAATHVDLPIPRACRLFYVYYPLHLAVIWLLQRLFFSGQG